MLLKMKDNRHGDAPPEPANDPAATAGGDTTREEEGKSEEDDTENPGGVAAGGGFASAAHTHTHTHTGPHAFVVGRVGVRVGGGGENAEPRRPGVSFSHRSDAASRGARRARGFDALDGPF